ncbi:MAG: hypothetical protein Terrestrivirus8_38 [Terrestrivirus sp.]|uniref:Uncharacterized protein n=1 Tax=Terrestrivirus sp. TaxID=2487775 RepID=A0A3G4ZNU4_9VIRU|nr:MAG: hypothetical protein Terrestrivirus8_38 [Terrestrivirus sp.]
MYTIKRIDNDATNIKIQLCNVIPGLSDDYIKVNEGHSITSTQNIYSFKCPDWGKNIKKLHITKDNCIYNKPCLGIKKKDETNVANNIDVIVEDDIDNSLYIEIINFIKKYYNHTDKNNRKHLLPIRINNKCPITNFLIPNTKILDIFISVKTKLQFVNSIQKINDSYFKIILSNDLYFKDQLFMYVKGKDGKNYYIDEFDIKFDDDNNELYIGGIIKNDDIVPNDKIKESYLNIFIEILCRDGKNSMNRPDIETSIKNFYKLQGNESYGKRFMDEINNNIDYIVNALHNKRFFLVCASIN